MASSVYDIDNGLLTETCGVIDNSRQCVTTKSEGVCILGFLEVVDAGG